MLVCVDTIYVDSLFALNLIADYLLLIVSARAASAVIRRWRCVLAAVLGAAYAVASVVPEWGILTSPIPKIALGVGMCLIAYGRERRFWRCCGIFFAVSALFGGAVWAVQLLAGYDAVSALYVPISWRVLVFAFALCYAAATLLFRGAAAKRSRRTVTLTVRLGGMTATLRALADTGNELTEPVSGRAVIVADTGALKPLLGTYADNADAVRMAEELSRIPGLEGRVSLVPYHAVGVKSGLLAALRPDGLTLDGRRCDALVALGNVRGADYDAVAPGSILM